MGKEPQRTDRTDEFATFDRDMAGALHGGRFLTEDVTQSDLAKYPDHQLEARLIQYERDYTFERHPRLRAEFKAEVDRTRLELNRRKMYATREAERVFTL